MSTVLKIEPIAFQQYMQIERGYQPAITDFGIFEDFENKKNTIRIVCFPKFPQNIHFQKNGICEKRLVHKYL